MPIELHVPDLPPLTLGGMPPPLPRVRQPWHWRVRQALVAYLPMVLMALLALTTWWLVKHAPGPIENLTAAPLRHEPDYTMERFTLHRFGPDGQLHVQVEGEHLRHYPDTDTLEIDTVRIRVIQPAGRGETLATARRAIANGDASEVQLLGGAHVQSEVDGEAIEFDGEFLHAFLNTERVTSHLPVRVKRDGSDVRADALDYDHLTRTVQLKGRVRAVVLPARKG
jgi:lipopolysaccharide export system protein LptC